MSTDATSLIDDASGPTAADAIQRAVRFLKVLRHRKMVVIAALLASGLLGALYFFTATRIYQAKASLLILQTGAEVWSTGMSAENRSQALIPTYERLFSQDVVLQGALDRLRKAPPNARIDLAGRPPEQWIETIRRGLSAKAIRRTNLIELSYRSKSRQAAQFTLDAILQSYLDFMDRNHRDVSAEIVMILDKERSDVERRLHAKQNELLQIKRKVGDLGLREGSQVVHPAVQRVVELNQKLLEVQEQRLQLQASLAAIRAAVRNGGDLRQHLIAVEPIVGRELISSALGLSPQMAEAFGTVERKLIEDRAKLQTLQAHYGPRHPRVEELAESIANSERYLADYQAKINDRLAGVQGEQLGPMLVGMVEEKLAEVWTHEDELSREYNDAEAKAVQLNDRMAELSIAEHDLALLRKLHDTLLDRIASIDIQQNQADVRAAVVSEPTASDQPVSPQLALVAIFCLAGGLGGGGALVYVLDLLDDRFRSPEEIKEQLGVPVLAVIRKLPMRAGAGADSLQAHAAPTAVESEAFRTLRTTLAFSGQETERLALTSPEPGDGKTTVLANLGISFAQAGKRTLLVDADLRRPGLSKLFGFRAAPGLADALRGDDDPAAACRQRIQPTGVQGLDLLPCGPKPPDPTELLSHARLADLIAWAETTYDQVLIDCPPALAASDAAIVGRATDGAILVVQPEKNHRRLVLRAAESLHAVGAPMLGVVANRVCAENDTGYYGTGYGYGYGYGYEESERDEESTEQPRMKAEDGGEEHLRSPRRAA